MKLRDSLFTIISERHDGGVNDYTIKLNPTNFIYAAHFPGEPITPGVCIMQTAHELLETAVGADLSVRRVKNIKFLKIIKPDMTPCITFSFTNISTQANSVKAQAIVRDDENLYAKLSLECQIAE